MAASSTIQLLNTVEWSKKFNFGRRSVLGNFLEPAMTSANTVLQTILSAPFAWRWNRTTITFTTIAGQQDYSVPCPTFGWIETSSVQDALGTWYEMTSKLCLGKDSRQGRPGNIAAQSDDGQGNVTFRLMPAPSAAFPVSVTIQQKPTLFTSVSQTWAPIPDEFSHIFNWGFLSLMWLFSDDPRFGVANQKFVSQLLGASEGLTETQRNIFLQNWQAITGQPISNSDALQQGVQARGM